MKTKTKTSVHCNGALSKTKDNIYSFKPFRNSAYEKVALNTLVLGWRSQQSGLIAWCTSLHTRGANDESFFLNGPLSKWWLTMSKKSSWTQKAIKMLIVWTWYGHQSKVLQHAASVWVELLGHTRWTQACVSKPFKTHLSPAERFTSSQVWECFISSASVTLWTWFNLKMDAF